MAEQGGLGDTCAFAGSRGVDVGVLPGQERPEVHGHVDHAAVDEFEIDIPDFREAILERLAELGDGAADALMRSGKARRVAEAVAHKDAVVGGETDRRSSGMAGRAAPGLDAFEEVHFPIVELTGKGAVGKDGAEGVLYDAEFLNEGTAGHDNDLRRDFLAIEQVDMGGAAVGDTHDRAFLKDGNVLGQDGVEAAQHVCGVHQKGSRSVEGLLVIVRAYAPRQVLSFIDFIVNLHLVEIPGFLLHHLEGFGLDAAQVFATGIPVHLDAGFLNLLAHVADDEGIQLVVHEVVIEG